MKSLLTNLCRLIPLILPYTSGVHSSDSPDYLNGESEFPEAIEKRLSFYKAQALRDGGEEDGGHVEDEEELDEEEGSQLGEDDYMDDDMDEDYQGVGVI